MKDFKDKVAVIAGAASGIGKGLAHHCAQQEMKIVLADIIVSAICPGVVNTNIMDAERNRPEKY